MTFVFVVLHYLVYKDTIECVQSIINNVVINKSDNYYIIVVDNGSPNDSFSILKKELVNKKVVLLHNKENLGFAKGNNIGFKYAKEVLKADFIALINNDTIISQENWISKSIELYNKYHYAVLGPDIITADGSHQNPFYSTKWTIKTLHKARLKQQIKLLLTILGIDKLIAEKETQNKLQTYVAQNVYDTDLHGACLIFSKIYIDIFDGLCERTFLYMEEEILRLYLDIYNLHSLYSPEISIYHKEDMATKACVKIPRKRRILKYRYWINSSKVYESLLMENNERNNKC